MSDSDHPLVTRRLAKLRLRIGRVGLDVSLTLAEKPQNRISAPTAQVITAAAIKSATLRKRRQRERERTELSTVTRGVTPVTPGHADVTLSGVTGVTPVTPAPKALGPGWRRIGNAIQRVAQPWAQTETGVTGRDRA
jgi:hypothetical protein